MLLHVVAQLAGDEVLERLGPLHVGLAALLVLVGHQDLDGGGGGGRRRGGRRGASRMEEERGGRKERRRRGSKGEREGEEKGEGGQGKRSTASRD